MTVHWKKVENHTKKKLAAGGVPYCMWLNIPWIPIIEILGDTELDAVFIDLEHSSYGLDTLELMVGTAELYGITPLVRPPGRDPHLITRILDLGAHGIIFPMIETADEAREATAMLHYKPRGTRGWGGGHTRWAGWARGTAVGAMGFTPEPGSDTYSHEFVQKASDFVLNAFIIESELGVKNVEEILDAGQPDLVLFGTGDYQVEAEFNPEIVQAAAKVVYNAAKARDIATAIIGTTSGSMYENPGRHVRIVQNASLIAGGALREAVEKAIAADAG